MILREGAGHQTRKVTVLIDGAAPQFVRQTPIGVNRPHSIVAR